MKTKKEKVAEAAAKKAALDAMNDKVYSYMKLCEDGVFRRFSFRYEDRTAEDINHFAKKIADEYDKAPLDSKLAFILMAFPRMREFMKEHEPELLVALLADPEGLKVVN